MEKYTLFQFFNDCFFFLSETYKVGDLVNCRMALDKPWMNGVVSHIAPLSIQLNGSGKPYLFRHVRHQVTVRFFFQRPSNLIPCFRILTSERKKKT